MSSEELLSLTHIHTQICYSGLHGLSAFLSMCLATMAGLLKQHSGDDN